MVISLLRNAFFFNLVQNTNMVQLCTPGTFKTLNRFFPVILQNPDNEINLSDKNGLLIEDMDTMKLFSYIINNIICGQFMLLKNRHSLSANFSSVPMSDGYWQDCPSIHLCACHTGQKKTILLCKLN